jgi:hypothetical protein
MWVAALARIAAQRVAAGAHAGLTGIVLRAGVAVVAGSIVSLGWVRAQTGAEVAGARNVALIKRGAHHWHAAAVLE